MWLTGDRLDPRVDGQHVGRGQQDVAGARHQDLRNDGLEPRRQGHPGRVRHLLHDQGGRQTIADGISRACFDIDIDIDIDIGIVIGFEQSYVLVALQRMKSRPQCYKQIEPFS